MKRQMYAGMIAVTAAAMVLSVGCQSRKTAETEIKTEKVEETEKKKEVDLKKLEKANRMTVVAEEYKTVKETITLYDLDGTTVMNDAGGELYYETYDEREVNLWVGQNGVSIALAEDFGYQKKADGAVNFVLYPRKEQRKANAEEMISKENKSELFQISKEGKEEIISKEYNEEGDIKVITSIDLSKTTEEIKNDIGADSGEAEYEYLFDPDTNLLQKITIYYTPVDGERVTNTQLTFAYGEETPVEEYMEQFKTETGKTKEITCIVLPGTKEEEKYSVEVPDGIAVTAAAEEGETVERIGDVIYLRKDTSQTEF